MSIARRSHEDEAGTGAIARHGGRHSGPDPEHHTGHHTDDHDARNRTGTRKQGMLRTAVTVTATGFALAMPLGPAPEARADLNPAVLHSMQLDSATLKQVKAYDRYRTREAEQRKAAKKALKFARKQIGKPYQWGAEGPGSYDCSGLVMAAWRKAGVDLPRVTHAQYRSVKRKVKLKNLKRGDLVFFRNRNHVGLYAGKGKYLHAPRTGERIRIDKLSKRRKAQFAGAVRPGAPEHKMWSASVKELAEKIDRMSAEKNADQKPPDSERNPQTPPPNNSSPETDNPPSNSPAQDPAQQAAPPGGPAAPKPGASTDQSPDAAQPAPRPRNETRPAGMSPQASLWYRSQHRWALYPGPYGVLAMPGHTAV